MANRRSLTDANITDLVARPGESYAVWDTKLPHLCVRVQGTGKKNFYFVYSFKVRVRWFKIGPTEMGASVAKDMAKKLMCDVSFHKRDPQAERAAQHSTGVTFAQLQKRYVDEYAKKHNKSWAQAN